MIAPMSEMTRKSAVGRPPLGLEPRDPPQALLGPRDGHVGEVVLLEAARAEGPDEHEHVLALEDPWPGERKSRRPSDHRPRRRVS